MNTFVVFAKAPGGELQRFSAAGCGNHRQAIAMVKEQMPTARVFVDLSLTQPTKSV